MFKIRITNGVKTALVILNQIFALVLITVLIMTNSYGVNNGSWDDLLAHRNYEQSEYFRTQSLNQATRAIRAATRATRFEKNGVYDPQRLVNISEYANKGILTGEYEAGGLYYRLSDLLNWAQNGWSYSKVEIDAEGYLSFYLDEREGTSKLQEDLESYFIASDSEWAAYYQYYQNVSNSSDNADHSNYSKAILNEEYQPENYDNIVSYANETGQDLQTLYDQMDKTLKNIVSDVLSYRDNVNLFATESSNIRYFLIDRENAQIYTNDMEYQQASEEEIIKHVKSYGAYCIYDNAALSVDAEKLELTVTDLYGYVEKYGMSGSDNYVLIAAVDTEYPAEDIFFTGYTKYQSLQTLAWLILMIGMIGILGYIATFAVLTAKAGIDPGESGIRLNWFDQWKTEVSILIILLIAFIGIISMKILSRFFSFMTWEGIIGFVALAENCIFLTAWCSLIRRAKAKILWKNSYTFKVLETLKSIFVNSRRPTKVLIFFGSYCLVNLFLCGFMEFGMILIILFNAAVAVALLKRAVQDQKLLEGMKRMEAGEINYHYDEEEFTGFRQEFAHTLNSVNEVVLSSVMESMKNERMQTDLITNVSHDIKTPLTSIINYVALLKRENIDNERAQGYIEVLEQKSMRLKHLTEDLVEASKISSGNIKLECMQIQMQEMIYQAGGEFADRFKARGLTLIENLPQEPLYIRADGRRLWRVLENLFNNVAKYAMQNTRVYVDLLDLGSDVKFSIKNISEQRLNIEAKDLTERFIRGDISRSTEGSGLGLSIAKNLTELQGGRFDIYLDGDLFRVTITFPKLEALPDDMSIEVLEENIESGIEQES